MPIPKDYEERVYAGVLGKIIGVYVGKPVEGWTYDRIMAELGEITGYVHHRFGRSVVEIDDDIAGTFTFVRALADYGNTRDITAEQIGRMWLNYLIEERTVLWWGGLGASTEHTAYLRLKSGVPAPKSGSIEINGPVVAQQIGAQIFIDGWAMVAPGDPELAAEFAGKAASVSHDAEAIYGAQVIAAMEALAFVESDVNKLLDAAVTLIPKEALIYRMIGELRELHTTEPDWRKAREWLATEYPYSRFGGGCPMVPNHGLIILSLLYGEDDFQRSLMIVNTSGWDTDCNSGNLGCLLGIKNGLACFEGEVDWRGPVADRLYVPAADAGRAVTDAAKETYAIVNSARALQALEPVTPKDGARFHFELPGSVQGFTPEDTNVIAIENVEGHSRLGKRSLAIRYKGISTDKTARAHTATFFRPEQFSAGGYRLMGSPTLYSGQTVRAGVSADAENKGPVTCKLYISTCGAEDEPAHVTGPKATLEAGAEHEFTWRVPDTKGSPIARIGVELSSKEESDGTVYLDYLTWDGAPDVSFGPAGSGGTMWQRAWVNGVDQCYFGRKNIDYSVGQNRGTGLFIQGTREWTDYRVSARVRIDLAVSAGIAARVQGMRRHYALLLVADGVRLVKSFDEKTTLAEAHFDWTLGEEHELTLELVGPHIRAWVDGGEVFDVADTERPLTCGAIALIVEEGRLAAKSVRVSPPGT